MKYEDVLTEGETPKTPHPSKTSKYPISVGKVIDEPTTEMTFTVVDDDVVGSTVADKESCAAARALCRIPEIEHAWVFRTVTLVKLKSGKIERYQNPATLKKAVETFDGSAGLFPAGEYVLKPLNNAHRKEYKRKWNEAHPNRHGGKRPYEYAAPPKPLRKK